ncbi:carboxymuconolactone decarboxylase family protein [Aurantivibrio infirmus]
MMKTSARKARIQPRPEPWPSAIAETLSSYPQGKDGLIRLFRTLAHSHRTLARMGHGMVLDKESPLSIKQREILILKVSALCQCPYEWGIHVKVFTPFSGLNEAQIANTCVPEIDRTLWSKAESLLLTLADEIHRTNTVNDQTWEKMREHWDTEQIMEIIFICGFYHTIAYFNNVLQIEQEDGAPTF